ncbi:hypothetical protein [Pseudenhygromyxa sp. WMMC2535]|uniref:hypothetical protein n=1 Tax=Pseudenhygromyxa sp. WMMC2535 TaxID=2712867 RepID=UPI001557549F|nr:hypothetical protein [Pseudenhygromyxa sp. WMMC2535]
MFKFVKTSGNDTRAEGLLYLNGKTFAAVSGGYGNGALSNGSYSVKVTRAVEGKHLKSGFQAGGVGFFIPIEHTSDSSRSGLGIHPDGNKPGTLGCIGISAKDASNFLKAWTRMSLGSRPTKLIVSGP